MNQEMTFGQALDWMGGDSRKMVESIGAGGANILRFNCDKSRFEALKSDGSWEKDNGTIHNFGIMWRPYVAPKPKSKIEEAIEREMVAFYGLPVEKIIDGGGAFPAIINRIVNLTLDEAKKAATSGVIGLISIDREALDRIDALKVTP